MDTCLNPDNRDFQLHRQSKIFVDKSLLLAKTNAILNTRERYICVTRPRRFGKTMAIDMLTAYYARGNSSRHLFSDLKIASEASFEEHLNRYNVIKFTMTDYSSLSIQEMKKRILYVVKKEIVQKIPSCTFTVEDDLAYILRDFFQKTKIPLIFIIDEWDCIMRKSRENEKKQEKYLDFLREILKDKSYIALVYMTGILPIKKYGEHSALNMFTEYSMQDQGVFKEMTGFTKEEVKDLCARFGMSYREIKKWYDGYNVNGSALYNPYSVVSAMMSHEVKSYWRTTESYEALKRYIISNMDGLREKVELLIAGETIPLDIDNFKNDMINFGSADDVLTLLVHLGYLTYDCKKKTCKIPNEEVAKEFIISIKQDCAWKPVMNIINRSEECLEAIVSGGKAAATLEAALAATARSEDPLTTALAVATEAQAAELSLLGANDRVARILEQAHEENVGILQYNDENSLAYTVMLALYSARDRYSLVREMPTGKGYADIALIPILNTNLPGIIIELKKDENPSVAMRQMKERNYAAKLFEFTNEVILVGVSYFSDSTQEGYKKHQCKIEKLWKA